MKKHLFVLTDKQSQKLKEIKVYLRLHNLNDTFVHLINNFNGGFKDYLKEEENKRKI